GVNLMNRGVTVFVSWGSWLNSATHHLLDPGSVAAVTGSTARRGYLAEGEGFEPPVPFRVQWFSRPPPSTTRPSLPPSNRRDEPPFYRGLRERTPAAVRTTPVRKFHTIVPGLRPVRRRAAISTHRVPCRIHAHTTP